ncbi:NAD-dependent epimerase/dehydratase family protein [Halobaculum magnesiiphilum]|uniref:NAD-dependent epimerase/dehydratase family protein n=1 Tax=Halobaculum magnesiiphilum TaxID=1017351 RepID=A0A8T8WB61_9EURY|nr:NAD-dependent epimerase/dehydratase family protein [Halobaculum magnesiiphilum]QZP37089.1 NAD-dependent epimerase/dehydratase family protein [Halobaculum magnesiiphilum]
MKLVTGGSGFVGGHIVEQLLKRGADVRVFDQHPPEIGADQVEYVEGDIRDPTDIRQAMDGVDTVYHNVALVPVTKAGDRFRQVNVEGTRQAMNAAQDASVDRFIHMGSSSVYSLDQLPITENSLLQPKGPYSESKLKADEVALQATDVDVTVIRPRTVVGKRRAGIFQILFEWISQGRRVYLVGSGNNTFQMVSGRDIATAAIAAADSETAIGQIYNIGTDEFGTMREAYESLISHAGTGSTVTSLPRLPTKFGMWALDTLDYSPLTTFHYKTIDKDFYFDISRARDDLNWEPQDSNADCLRRGYEWFIDSTSEESEESGEGHRKAPEQGALNILRKLS